MLASRMSETGESQPSRAGVAAVAFVFAITLVPVWYFRWLPTQDGSVHVENAVVLRELLSGQGAPNLSKFYEINPSPDPNWTGQVLLTSLTVVTPARVAEKLLVSFYLIGVPLTAGWCAHRFRRGTWVIGTMLAMPFLYSLALHKGLYNFCLALGMFFVIVGYWSRCSFTWRNILVQALLGLLLYFTHIVPLVMAVLVCVGMAVLTRRGGRMLLAFLPAVALGAWFFISSPVEASDRRELWTQLIRLMDLDVLYSFTPVERLLAMGVAIVLGATCGFFLLIKLRLRRWESSDLLLLASLGAAVVYLASPNSAAGGGQIAFRLSLFPWLLLIVWLAVQRGRMVAVAAVVVATLSLGGIAARWRVYQSFNEQMSELQSTASSVPANATLFPVDLSMTKKSKPLRVRPMWHAQGSIAARQKLVDLGNYQAAMGYFPIRFRASVDRPQRYDSTGEEMLDWVDTTPVPPEYVLLWMGDPGKQATPTQLIDRYQEEAVSSHGRAVLYHLRTK